MQNRANCELSPSCLIISRICMCDALGRIFAEIAQMDAVQIEQADSIVRNILQDYGSESFHYLLAMLSDAHCLPRASFCAVGALKTWKGMYWEKLNANDQLIALTAMKPLLFQNGPVLRPIHDIFFAMANRIEAKPLWEELISYIPQIPKEQSLLALMVLANASKFFQQFPVEWDRLCIFAELTRQFFDISMLDNAVLIRLAVRSIMPLLIMYVVKGSAADPSLHAQDALTQFLDCCTFMSNIIPHCGQDLEHVKLCSTISKFVNEILSALQVTNQVLYHTIRNQFLPVLWTKVLTMFHEMDSSKKYLTHILRPVAFFSRGFSMDTTCFNWVVLFSAITREDVADFCYNPMVYYSFAYSLHSPSLRSCALNLAITVAQDMDSSRLISLVSMIPPVEQGAILLARLSKAFIRGGDETKHALYVWVTRYMLGKKRLPEIATALFFLSKVMPCVTNNRDVEVAVKMAFDFIDHPLSVVACNAAKLLHTLMKFGLQMPVTVIPVLARLSLVAVTPHPLIILNEMAENDPQIYANLIELAEPCVNSIYREIADLPESRNRKMLDADLNILIGIASHHGDINPEFAECLFQACEHMLRHESFDAMDKLLKLMNALIANNSVNTVRYIHLLIALLGEYQYALEYLVDISGLVLLTINRNLQMFIEARLGETVFGTYLGLLTRGIVADPNQIFTAAEILTSVLSVDASFDAEPVMGVIGQLLETNSEPGLLAGLDLFAGFLVHRTTQVTEEMLRRWCQFLVEHSVPSAARAQMHLYALHRVSVIFPNLAEIVSLVPSSLAAGRFPPGLDSAVVTLFRDNLL